MSAKAQINPTWKWKWVIMSVALALFGGWCVYDAKVTYPEEIRHGEAFKAHKEALDKALTDGVKDELMLKWKKVKEENGWTKDKPSTEKTQSDIDTQWIMLYMCIGMSLACLIWLAMNVKQKLHTSENGLTGPGGADIPFDSMTRIDKELWMSKGIAYVEYEHGGKKGRVKIDDWIYQDADQVLEDVEQQSGIIPDDGDEEDE